MLLAAAALGSLAVAGAWRLTLGLAAGAVAATFVSVMLYRGNRSLT